MFTCGISQINWQYSGPSASMSLNITNLNISQQAPLSTSTSTSDSTSSAATTTPAVQLRRQYSGYGGSYLPNINEQLADQLDPASNNWTWNAVNVPQGWYQMLANVQGVLQSSSISFFVLNGTDVACVPQFATDSSTSSTTSPVPVSTAASAPASASPSAVVGTSSSHSHAGAIAGGVVGGIAFFAAALAAFFFWFLRRRSDRSRGADNGRHSRGWSAMALKNSRHANDGRRSTRRDHSGLPAVDADQTFIGSDEELSAIGHEKAVAPISPAPVLPYHPSSNPQSKRTSTQTNGSYGRTMSNPEPPIRPPSYQPHVGELFPLERPQTAGNERPQTAGNERPQTAGNGPRRKPAPRYDEPVQAVAEPCSSRTTLDSNHGITSPQSHGNGNGNGNGDGNSDSSHALQHQSSFGAMRPMHVMMPDPPPPARA